MTMRAGKLRQMIVIQSHTFTTDDFGGQIEAWADVATVAASVEPLSGRELIAAQAAQSEITTRFVVRYLAGIEPAMRIVYNGKIYNISAIIDPEERHRELQIMTATGLNQG